MKNRNESSHRNSQLGQVQKRQGNQENINAQNIQEEKDKIGSTALTNGFLNSTIVDEEVAKKNTKYTIE